jgi:hypothetical protein
MEVHKEAGSHFFKNFLRGNRLAASVNVYMRFRKVTTRVQKFYKGL